jgi:hypothetical protein
VISTAGTKDESECRWIESFVVISNSCPILQQLMSSAVALKPVLPIFQVLAWRVTHISQRFWTSIADKGCFGTENVDMFSAQLAA